MFFGSGLYCNGPLGDAGDELLFVGDVVLVQPFNVSGDMGREAGFPLQRCKVDIAVEEPFQGFRCMEEMDTRVECARHECRKTGPLGDMVHALLERHEDGLRMYPAHMDDAHKTHGAGEAKREPPRYGARIKALLDILAARGREHKVDSLA